MGIRTIIHGPKRLQAIRRMYHAPVGNEMAGCTQIVAILPSAIAAKHHGFSGKFPAKTLATTATIITENKLTWISWPCTTCQNHPSNDRYCHWYTKLGEMGWFVLWADSRSHLGRQDSLCYAMEVDIDPWCRSRIWRNDTFSVGMRICWSQYGEGMALLRVQSSQISSGWVSNKEAKSENIPSA